METDHVGWRINKGKEAFANGELLGSLEFIQALAPDFEEHGADVVRRANLPHWLPGCDLGG